MSRAFGDFVYKNRHDLPAAAQQVSAEPDIIIEERQGTEEFIVLACDGIWDVMSNDDVCHVVRDLLSLGETDLGLIAEELIDRCLDLGSRDNMSAAIVALPGIRYGSGDGVQGLRAERAKKAEEEAQAQGDSNAPPQSNLSQEQQLQLQQGEQILRMLVSRQAGGLVPDQNPDESNSN